MKLTNEERSHGGAAVVQTIREMGGTKEDAQRFADALYADDDEPTAESVEAEGEPQHVMLATGHEILLESDGRLGFARQYGPETQRAIARYLDDHPLVLEQAAQPRRTVSAEVTEQANRVEQERRIAALPTFDQLASGNATIILEAEPEIRDVPIPGEYSDPTAALADMFLEGNGIRTGLPAHDGLPIPDLFPEGTAIPQEMAGGMPVPGSTLQSLHVGGGLMMEPLPPLRKMTFPGAKFSGEWAQGLPIPD